MPEARLEENKAVVRRFGEAINKRDFDALDQLVLPTFVRHCQATPEVQVYSLEDFKQYLRDDLERFPDFIITPGMIVAEGDLVAVYMNYSGTQKGAMGPFPPSGRRVNLDCSGIVRLESGRIAEMWIIWDNLAALVQLGHIEKMTGS